MFKTDESDVSHFSDQESYHAVPPPSDYQEMVAEARKMDNLKLARHFDKESSKMKGNKRGTEGTLILRH